MVRLLEYTDIISKGVFLSFHFHYFHLCVNEIYMKFMCAF